MADLFRTMIITVWLLIPFQSHADSIKTCKLSDLIRFDVYNIEDCIQAKGKIFNDKLQDSVESFLLKIHNNTPSKNSFLIRMNEFIYLENEVNPSLRNTYTTYNGQHFYGFELIPDEILLVNFYCVENAIKKPTVIYFSDKKLLPVLTFESGNLNFINGLIIYGLIFILSFMSLMILGGFIITRNAAYAFYSGYVIILWLYFTVRFLLFQWFSIHDEDESKIYMLFNMATQPVFYIFYGKFVQNIINSKANYPGIHHVLRQFVYISGLSTLIIIVAFYMHEFAAVQIFNVYRIIAIVYSYYLIYSIYKTRDKLGKYVVTGTLMLVTGAMLAMFFSFYKVENLIIYPINFFNLGIVLELLFFTLGLAQKTAIETNKKLEAQMELNKILKENELFQSNVNEQLSKQLEKAKNTILIEQEQKINTQIELKRKESELAILLNQLNPHFIFNSLNSLKKYIVKEEKNTALNHIDQFSQLIRNFLEFSREKNVPISEITKNLSLYVDLESKRIGKKIMFSVSMNDEIEPEFDEIPALLIQPFVENAILHGISHPSIKSPQINVSFFMEPGYITITIEDNGIGRQATNHRMNHDSNLGIATKITEATIHLINDETTGLEIEDLFNADGTPAGTKVKVKLKKSGTS